MSDESKLPKWAREEMASLRRQVAEAKADRDMIVNGGDPAKCEGFWLEGYIDKAGDYPLPVSGRRLEYRDDLGEIRFRRITDRTGTWLELNGNGGEGLLVRPWVTNVVHVRVF